MASPGNQQGITALDLAQWHRVEEIFEAALELPPQARAAFLDEACSGDHSLRQVISSLLIHDEQAKSFIEDPIFDIHSVPTPSGVSELSPGQSIDSYTIVREIGRGGMGVVYLADDTKLKRQVALKLLPERYITDGDRVRRFKREAFAASALNHPNILTIYDIGQSEYGYYIVTEFVDGQTLREHIGNTQIGHGEILEIMIQVASALKAAHSAGIVHRDIKPENIMLRHDGIVKVLDFGLAKLVEQQDRDSSPSTPYHTRPNVLMGTPNYMSPEQVVNAHTDGRSDLFSLGAVLYECITLKPAFSGRNIPSIWGQIQYVEPPPLSDSGSHVPPKLERITFKLLAKNVEQRYQSADELLKDLRKTHDALQGARVTSDQQPRFRVNTGPIKVLTTLPTILRRPRYSIPVIISAVLITSFVYWRIPDSTNSQREKAQYWYQKGAEALRNGAYYLARVALERAIQADSKSALAYARLAEAYLELDNKDKARDSLYQVSKLVPDRSKLSQEDRLYIESIMALAAPQPDYASAVENYNELIRLTPNQPYYYVDLGRTYEKTNQIDKAKSNYERAAEIDPEYATAFLRLGILYGRQQEAALSDQAFRQAEDIYIALGNTEGRTEVHYQRGLALLNAKKIAESHTELQQAYDMARVAGNEAQQILSLLQLCSVLIAEGNTQQAQQFARDALDIAQQGGMQNITMRGLVDIGRAFFHRGGPEDLVNAEKYFNQALEYALMYKDRRNEARARFQLGSFLLKMGKTDEGLINMEGALEFYKEGGYANESWDAMRLIGRARREKGEYDEALRTFNDLLELARQMNLPPRIADAHGEIGRVLEFKEKFPEALSHFDEGYKTISGTSNQEALGYLAMNRGRVLWQLGQYEDAIAAFKQASDIADNKYVGLSIAINQFSAEMELSRRHFKEVKAKMQPVLDQIGKIKDEEAVTEVRRLLGLAETLSGNKAKGIRLCSEAVENATQTGDSLLLTKSQLSLAGSVLEVGRGRDALEIALQAQGRSSSAGQLESEWRAWLIAARASRILGDVEQARAYTLNAGRVLSALAQQWGTKDYNTYLNRPDIQQLQKQLRELGIST